MTKFYAIVTNQGAARIANAVSLGTKLNITHMAVGDGGGVSPTPNASQTKLVNEVRRAAINSLSVDEANSSQIIAEQIIPETEGGFWIREMGLFDGDGTLIAVCNTADTYKPLLQEGSGRTQRLRMIIVVSSTDAITLKIDPAVVLATRQYVDSQMQEHIGADDPHTQYLQKEQLSSATDSDSDTQAATPKAVKAVSPGRLLKIKDYSASATHTFTPGTKKVRVRAWSAGGGGGGTTTSGGGGASGGAGGYLEGIYDVSDIPSLAIVVGIGGAAAAAGTTAYGGNGGATTITALGISITGGGGGNYYGSSSTGGGTGGSPTGPEAGTFNKVTGQSGQGGVTGGLGGTGGASYGSYGGLPHSSGAGDDGCYPAGGGAGASYPGGGTARAAGGGGNGLVILEEYA